MNLLFRSQLASIRSPNTSARGISLLELVVSLALASLIFVVGASSVRTVLRYRTVRSVATEIVRILDATALRAQALRADALVTFGADSKRLRVTFMRSRLVGERSKDTASTETTTSTNDTMVEQSEFTLQSFRGTKIETRFAGATASTGTDGTHRTMTLYATGTASPGTISITDEDSITCVISQALRGARSFKCA